MKENNKVLGTMALSLLKGIGPSFVKKVISKKSFESNDIINDIKHITDFNNKVFSYDIIHDAVDSAREIMLKCEQEGIVIIDLMNENYPSLLRDIKDPPSIIYCKGNLKLLQDKKMCIVGSRKPNENAAKISERVGFFYSNSKWVICNGLAEGVDDFSIKHDGQIHGKIIGVLAGGLNYNSKKILSKKMMENAEKVISKGGLLVSEMPPDRKEDTFSVVKSCRIQAGISDGLILVQSSLDGGSRFAVKSFCETQRPIAIVNPVKSDFELSMYNANKSIVENHKKGLSVFTELKEDKIQSSIIFIIKSKNDYGEYENIISRKNNNILKFNKTLFG